MAPSLASLSVPAGPGVLSLSELMSAFSYALDLTEGQPEGHCMRACWIGVHVGREAGLGMDELRELYYTILLKDAGCSSNAARIAELYRSDDRQFKHDYKTVGDGLPEVLSFVFAHAGAKAPLAGRVRSIMQVIAGGERVASELIGTRCQRGADIARLLRFPESVAEGIYGLDEHYNGKGRPHRVRGEDIPLYSRIALLAQVVDVFHTAGGREAAVAEVARRSGRWFDPRLVEAFMAVAGDGGLWDGLASPALERAVADLVQAERELPVDDDYLDDIAAAFGQVVDAKSPFTSGHSARVAQYTDLIAQHLGLPDERRRLLRRAALLHDVGKLGVSNSVLDKPAALDRDEWAAVQMHAVYSERILARVGAFAELATIAGGHHERLDGGGYPRGLTAPQIPLETRIITTADIFDAITAERPYRGAIPVPQALEMMAKTVGTALDADCFAALRKAVAGQEALQALQPAGTPAAIPAPPRLGVHSLV
ncbi:HD domain-containing protein [Pseudoduganella lurida]|uniref:HD domain-containing protein n=1 Tax=Pseudoduganella lurida TaxID=1036180 RepID=A0A562RDE2_9BURK|nr:HD-GYP domain-containing protein [Pseudoduganella lurida]TWI66564.1 HD domain-containing protein [Pseudoduganella lurida]